LKWGFIKVITTLDTTKDIINVTIDAGVDVDVVLLKVKCKQFIPTGIDIGKFASFLLSVVVTSVITYRHNLIQARGMMFSAVITKFIKKIIN
jgi:hypothetical protein